ncbi:MAG TPA: family 43 glycosylhydrolase [Acidimicrobiales bacterium]|jgi:hypothetical protein
MRRTVRSRLVHVVVVFAVSCGFMVSSPWTSSPVGASVTGGRTVDSALAYDAAGNRWVSVSSGEPLSSPGGSMCSPVDPVIQARGWTNVPVRTGPAPHRLRGCWEGDALRDLPSPWWAVNELGSVRAPSLLRVSGAWWLAYSARKSGSQQRCIGIASGSNALGPWTHPSAPLVCPPDGSSVGDPELFFSRADQKLYVLWSHAVPTAGHDCSSQIQVQQVDTNTRTVIGNATVLVDASTPLLGFDEVTDAACPGGVRHVVESPTMTRGRDGTLWLFFSANDRNSRNYATGFAFCGGGAPGSSGCALLNLFDPAQSRYRPLWGDAGRTAAVGGVNAAPYFAFPSHAGFGGLSLAELDPTGTAPQPIYATAQFWWSGDTHTQLMYRLDNGSMPALFEPETVAVAGAPGSFGSLASTPPEGTTPSGHSITTRAVPGHSWPGGYTGVFNARAADGTEFVGSFEQNGGFGHVTADGLVLGSYDPARSTWTNIPIKWNRLSDKTTTGTDTLPPVDPAAYGQTLPWEAATAAGRPESDGIHLAGATMGDVEPIDGGKAIAFTVPDAYPWAYAWLNGAGVPLPSGADGVWPAFGIVSKVDNEWKVATGAGWVNQWTGGQLAASVPRSPTNPDQPSISEQACAPTTDHHYGANFTVPPGESWCGSPNEMASLPRSHDIIVAQYARNFSDPTGTIAGGLMALRVTPVADGRYDVKVRGWEPLPVITAPSDPNIILLPTAKSIAVDPTGTDGDERFVVDMDVFTLNRNSGDLVLNRSDYFGAVATTVEFSYDAASGEIRPTSAPLLSQDLVNHQSLGAVGGAYDSDGNLWVQGFAQDPNTPFVGIYAKTNGQRTLGSAQCGFDPNKALRDYLTVGAKPDWGRACQPEYEIEAGRDFVRNAFSTVEFSEDPATKTMVMVSTAWARALSVRRSGMGLNMTFAVGDLVHTGEDRLMPLGNHRPGVFDSNGRLTFAMPGVTEAAGRPCSYIGYSGLGVLCPGITPRGAIRNWTTTIDVPQLFAPPPTPLPGSTGEPAVRIGAEQTATTATANGSAIDGTIPVRSVAVMDHRGVGYRLVGGSSGTVEYKVWVPVAGNYRLDYAICDSGVIRATVGSTSQSTAVTAACPGDGSPVGSTTTGPTFQLAAGLQTIRLNSTGGNWKLDWFAVSRL